MIKSGIEIKWERAREFIAIDFSSLGRHNDISSTLEWWSDEKCLVSYVTQGKITPQPDGAFLLKIKYEKVKNKHLPEGGLFGTSSILFKQTDKSGEAYWQGVGEKPNAEPALWTRITLDVGKKKAKITHAVTKNVRQQAMFRLALLAKYRCCAITKETTPSTLEAAHVVASRNNGYEVIGNGILLRADIHRLYDNGAFKISRKGLVKITKDFPLSIAYENILRKAILPPEVIADLSG